MSSKEWAEAEEIALDLNRYYTYYDLIYKDLDGMWKTVHAEVHYGMKITDVKEIKEFLEIYRRGREEWNLKIALFTVDIDVMPCKFE